MNRRPDIFTVEKSVFLRNTELLCQAAAVIIGVWLCTREIAAVIPGNSAALAPDNDGKVTVTTLPPTLWISRPWERIRSVEPDKKALRRRADADGGGTARRSGNPKARFLRKGLLGILSGQIKGLQVPSVDMNGSGGYADGIDAILSGLGGLKSGGNNGAGRLNAAGIGFGPGSVIYGRNDGWDHYSHLLEADDFGPALRPPAKGTITLSYENIITGGTIRDGRNRAEIQKVAALRYAYNKRLREKPGLKGTIKVKFAIDEFGKVVFCEIVDSSVDDEVFERTITEKIMRWVFGKIDKPGDVSEVIYPFVFSQ
jgi:hypothetical protein